MAVGRREVGLALGANDGAVESDGLIDGRTVDCVGDAVGDKDLNIDGPTEGRWLVGDPVGAAVALLEGEKVCRLE